MLLELFAIFSVLLVVRKLQLMGIYLHFLAASLLHASKQGGYLGSHSEQSFPFRRYQGRHLPATGEKLSNFG